MGCSQSSSSSLDAQPDAFSAVPADSPVKVKWSPAMNKKAARPSPTASLPVASAAAPDTEATKALRAQHAAYLEDTREARVALAEQFEASTASMIGHSPCKELFTQIGLPDPHVGPTLVLEDTMLDEFRRWMPARQTAAIRLLSYNPFITSVTLNNAALEDCTAPCSQKS